eukprot:7872489-Ditylum_brightwellii.AAC.1
MQAINLCGMEGQIIADVLQKGGNLCGVAQVLNGWKVSNGMAHVAVSTIKHHVDICMKAKKNQNTEGSIRKHQPILTMGKSKLLICKTNGN